ncbi:MAG: response regulator [Deltaproteobacteria bacterium]|nr:response regulator [Deltaproteobacteria bacterium]NNK07347.1 response regulator [Myxococcales bacterium]MBT8466758.1 response regulator [Deltaproteobacteria bacterium]MBT8483769.1 response regulator [Deltaproteobacteria bacterium]NNK43911.1 response regulator [Myxococcales bacterium]
MDDSSSVRKLLNELLRERGHEVTTLGTAEEGLEEFLRQPFQLMLVDWTLPGMSGLELCQSVRSRPGGDQVVILVITGRNRAEDLHTVLDAGASDYLSKPIDPELLGTRLLIAERAIAEAHRHEHERREMESRLAFADRMASIGTLTAGVAHELNNPLMYVLSNLRLTREELDAQADAEPLELAKQQLDEAIHGAIRMQNIVRDLKTFSRVDDEERGNVEVRHVVESSINISWNEIRHRAALERDFGETPTVDANESRLGQVFLNLLINAAQAMPDRSVSDNRITVRTHTDEDGWAVIEVADNGTGIEPDRMSHVFEPFFTTKAVSEGTGLGLSICRDIVRDAGGTIEARSEAGRGSTFVVRLPPSTRADLPQRTQAPPTATIGASATVIVIDDEPLVGRSIRRALRGHRVEVFSSGKEAISRLCSDEPFDVVFCDLMMPEVSGMDLFRQVSDRRPDLASRFVFMTGGAFTKKARSFLENTQLSCLEKPFELRQIRELVRERAEGASENLVAMGGLEPPT